MYTYLLRPFILLFLFPLSWSVARAQTIPVGSYQESEARSLQLSGKLDSSISFSVRPLSATVAPKFLSARSILAGKTFRFSLLPLKFIQQFNSHHPYGWNDAGMIPARGYQTFLSAGIYAAAGPFELQLQPEGVFAANTAYSTNSQYGSNNGRSYQKLFLGQSSVKVSFFNLSAGVSSENLWWGPGRRSALLMSNNAPGFVHGFFRSQRPVKTAIGSFEWQLIGGRITADRSNSFENFNLRSPGYDKSRYLSAYVISYQPKWVPGLFVGMTRSIQQYKSEMERLNLSLPNRYIPVLTKAFQKKNNLGDDTLNTDQLASFFLRWVFLKAKAEVYIEYGYNDYGLNIRDYSLGPSHSAAYLVGFRKNVELSEKKRIEFGFELTQMSQTPDWLVRDAGNWYVHSAIKEGYTHQNQILGAGAGLGANIFSMDFTLVKGEKRLGFLMERINRDPQYHSTQWIDFGLGFLPQWKYKQMLISGKLEVIRSKNYGWQPVNTVFNLHTQLSIQYQL